MKHVIFFSCASSGVQMGAGAVASRHLVKYFALN